ncbi:DNRLRE domain-containing protein [Nonomuraea sp. NPDC050556]|uniref:DNRLRE domain-containing protein n=1 Tax=Nonomuraea sp. NPDC050556 TaxID=3364369 RepID=UPI00378FBB06
MTALAVLAAGTPAHAAPTPTPSTSHTAVGAEADSSVDPSVAQALEQAKAAGKDVEVVAKRTERITVWAQPDGNLRRQVGLGPVRTKGANGAWHAIDADLVGADGVLRPRNTKGDLRISAGGDDKPLAQITAPSGEVYALNWPTPLPKPTVKANVATFADAAGPGADLQVIALSEGFTHNVILREKPKGPVEVRLPVISPQLKLSEDKSGKLELRQRSTGKLVGAASQPEMWDSTGVPPAMPGVRGKHSNDLPVTVETKGADTTLVLKPSASVLNDPKMTYPVTLDPITTFPTWPILDGEVNQDLPGFRQKEGILLIPQSSGYIKFDPEAIAAKPGERLITARLLTGGYTSSLNGTDCDTFTAGISAARVSASWSPQTITFATRPPIADKVKAKADGRQNCVNLDEVGSDGMYWQSFTFPVTKIVNGWRTGSANNGFALNFDNGGSTSRYVVLNSSRAVQKPELSPSLELTVAPEGEIPADARAALDRIRDAEGETISDADRATLLKYPEIAAAIIDPKKDAVGFEDEPETIDTEPTTSSAPAGAQMLAAAATSKCRVTNRWQTKHSLLGEILYKYHTRVQWCYNGTKVTKIPSTNHYFDTVSGVMRQESGGFLKIYNVSAATKEVHSQRIISNCAGYYGCFATQYPWNRVKVNAKGTVTSFTSGR